MNTPPAGRREQPSRNSASSDRAARAGLTGRCRRSPRRSGRPWSGHRPRVEHSRGGRSWTVSRARLAASASAAAPGPVAARVVADELTRSSAPGARSPSPSKRASTTVMLSGPSRSSAFCDQRLAGPLQFGSAIRIGRISSSADRTVQAVGADQHHVPLAQRDLGQHDLDPLLDPQRLQDDVRVLERLGLLGGHRAGLDELPGQRLVLGDLRQLALAQDVAARVANLRRRTSVSSTSAATVQVVPIPRSLWLSRDWTKIRSLASSWPGGGAGRTRRAAAARRRPGRRRSNRPPSATPPRPPPRRPCRRRPAAAPPWARAWS